MATHKGKQKNPRLEALNKVRRAFCAALRRRGIRSEQAIFALTAERMASDDVKVVLRRGQARLAFWVRPDRRRSWDLTIQQGFTPSMSEDARLRELVELTYVARSPQSLHVKADKWTARRGGRWSLCIGNHVEPARLVERCAPALLPHMEPAVPLDQYRLSRLSLPVSVVSSPGSKDFLAILDGMVERFANTPAD